MAIFGRCFPVLVPCKGKFGRKFRLLLAPTVYIWIAQLFTPKPYGISKRNELRSKKRVNYYAI